MAMKPGYWLMLECFANDFALALKRSRPKADMNELLAYARVGHLQRMVAMGCKEVSKQHASLASIEACIERLEEMLGIIAEKEGIALCQQKTHCRSSFTTS